MPFLLLLLLLSTSLLYAHLCNAFPKSCLVASRWHVVTATRSHHAAATADSTWVHAAATAADASLHHAAAATDGVTSIHPAAAAAAESLRRPVYNIPAAGVILGCSCIALAAAAVAADRSDVVEQLQARQATQCVSKTMTAAQINWLDHAFQSTMVAAEADFTSMPACPMSLCAVCAVSKQLSIFILMAVWLRCF
jgi:hypothetical protein